MITFEKKEEEIVDNDLDPVQQQLSATLQARLVILTGKEAFSIVMAA